MNGSPFFKKIVFVLYICCSYYFTSGIFHIFPLFQLCQNTLPHPKTKERKITWDKKLAATYMYFLCKEFPCKNFPPTLGYAGGHIVNIPSEVYFFEKWQTYPTKVIDTSIWSFFFIIKEAICIDANKEWNKLILYKLKAKFPNTGRKSKQ